DRPSAPRPTQAMNAASAMFWRVVWLSGSSGAPMTARRSLAYGIILRDRRSPRSDRARYQRRCTCEKLTKADCCDAASAHATPTEVAWQSAARIPAFPSSPACHLCAQPRRCRHGTQPALRRAVLPLQATGRAASRRPNNRDRRPPPDADACSHALHRRASGIRCPEQNAAARRPCPRRAIARTARWPGSQHQPSRNPEAQSVADDRAGLTVNPAHREDDLLVRSLDLAFDRRIEPAFAGMAIDDALWIFDPWQRIDEGEHLVAARGRRLPGEAESRFVLAGGRRDIEHAFRTLFQAQVLEIDRLVAQRGLADPDHDVAGRRQPFFAKIALVDLAL